MAGPHTKRVELIDGQYAVLKTKLPWGLVRTAMTLEKGQWLTLVNEGINRLVIEWNVSGDNGEILPIPRNLPEYQVDDLDADIVTKLVLAVQEIMTKAMPDPNAGSGSSGS